MSHLSNGPPVEDEIPLLTVLPVEDDIPLLTVLPSKVVVSRHTAPPAEPQAIRGYRTVVLGPTDPGYIVEAGRAAVFAVEVRDGVPAGQRTHVIDAARGDLVYGGVVGDIEYRFLVVTSDDAVLRPLADGDWADPGMRGKAEWWAERVGNLTADDFPLTDPPAAAGSSGPQRVPSGRAFRPTARTILWVTVDAGRATWFGLSDAVSDAGPVVLAVSTRAWLRATEDAVLTIAPSTDKPTVRGRSLAEIDLTRGRSSPDFTLNGRTSYSDFVLGGRVSYAEIALGPPADWIPNGLAATNAAALTALRHRHADRAAKEAARLVRRQQNEAADTVSAVGALAGSVAPQPDAPPPDGGLMAALHPIGRAIGVQFRSPPAGAAPADGGDPVAAVARASRVRFRTVQFRGQWWTTDAGPLLGFLRDGDAVTPVGLVRRRGRYTLFDPRTGTTRPLSATDRAALGPGAVMFYRPFPQRALGLIDLPRYALAQNRTEMLTAGLLAVAVTLLGLLVPVATQWLIDGAVPDADTGRVWEVAGVLVTANLLTALLLVVQARISLRVQAGVTAALQAATWDRLLRLPAGFFKEYASGDLLNRAMMVTEVSQALSGATVRTLFAGGLAVLNLGLLFAYSPSLAALGAGVGLLSAAVTAGLSLLIRRHAVAAERADGELFGLVVQLVNGAAKLRVAGAARRAFNFWAGRYADQLGHQASAARLNDASTLFHMVLPPLATLAVFAAVVPGLASGTGFTLGQFLAFNTTFLLFVGGVTAAGQVVVDLTDNLAKFRLLHPLLCAVPEAVGDRADPGRLTGAVTAREVVFRYTPGGPVVLNGVTVQAAPGEFIALVGPSGSGKSTLFRLLLGFEKPEAGGVFYDGMPFDGLDPTAVRRQFGVVLQTATISAGSIYDNIAFGGLIAPDVALQAARDAGMGDDLKAMPMGLHTVVAEGGTNLSGGQRQRLLIARALAADPRVILFDEATSALDNLTQATVTESLNRRKVTRVVVAHRLSTVRTADRIYVLADGAVQQVGTYDELARAEGLFRTMVERQSA